MSAKITGPNNARQELHEWQDVKHFVKKGFGKNAPVPTHAILLFEIGASPQKRSAVVKRTGNKPSSVSKSVPKLKAVPQKKTSAVFASPRVQATSPHTSTRTTVTLPKKKPGRKPGASPKKTVASPKKAAASPKKAAVGKKAAAVGKKAAASPKKAIKKPMVKKEPVKPMATPTKKIAASPKRKTAAPKKKAAVKKTAASPKKASLMTKKTIIKRSGSGTAKTQTKGKPSVRPVSAASAEGRLGSSAISNIISKFI
ncbi:hypothetical protein GNI_056450 [Gregarina niphandrodes]|uniref:Uncharacterized protein n=1 Tax=Gregarina niphandrodes TaxID=110365 RepID=A0A023B8Q2_GRENI|nr:hypothetical protein GNI_056450 [Gregarina niphandrodes]EZG70156.1 hypothetical protein GNI_056450 [Gregarina niphandrodes]|eukprot:XP_011129975.1 hypothetical protein GNI_056450 [Gregarina niphandrodes]